MNAPLDLAARHPLTPMQQGMLFHSLREPGSPVYFQQLVVRLTGPLDPSALQAAWGQVLARHEALRLACHWLADQPVQVFADPHTTRLPFALHDHRAAPPAEQSQLRTAFLAADRAQGFDFATPPLMRLALLRWADGCWDMVWSHHHVLLDGWSSGLVLAEVVQLYRAAREGQVAALPAPRPFSSFLRFLAERDSVAAESHWRQALAGFEQPTPLPVLQRPAAANPLAPAAPVAVLERALPPAQAEGLARLARLAGVTTAVPVLACWGLLLSRYTDSSDVVFGVTTAGRPAELAGADTLVGLLINTVPLRLQDVAGGDLRHWLGQVQQRLAAAREHEHTALTRIAEWSSVPRGQPLFHTLVVCENYPMAMVGNQLADARIASFHLDERSNYPLSLIVEPGPAEMALRLLVDSAQVTPAAGERMLDQFQHLLEQLAAADGTEAVDSLRLLRPAERDTMLHGWNDTAHPYDRSATLPGIVQAQALRTPQAMALEDEHGTLTYGDLLAQAHQLAAHLHALDLPACSPVGVRLGRDRWLVIALLAVVTAGHQYVPLEVHWPALRVAAILDTLPIRCLLTHSRRLADTRDLLGGRAMTVLAADAPAPASPGLASPAPLPGPLARPDQPAYVIFTSGSTGQPKGVQVLHTKAVNLIEWVNRRFEVGPGDRLLFVTSPAFDLSVYDIFGLLAAGGTLRIASDAELADPERLAQLLVHDGITFWDSAPAALWQLAPLLPEQTTAAPLRLVFMSGDWVPLPLPDRLKQVFPGVCVVALGGATEATVWSNFHVVGQTDPSWTSVPYGRPIQNARYYVLDARLEPCPVGVPGDLYIGGECLAEGYVGQPELTRERFIPDPFREAPTLATACAALPPEGAAPCLGRPGAAAAPTLATARMYRTGDRARFGADGTMEFLGRLDTQVKIRGFRIELGDIEAAMARHPAVRDVACVVLARGDGGPASGAAERDLAGYYVAHPGQSVSPDALRRHLAQTLPAPMVPAFLMALDSLPLSANGKVDRKSLPAPTAEPRASGTGDRPQDALQATIAAVWCEVLGLEQVDEDGDFFALGGHSLRATSAMARLRAALGLDMPLRLIFEHTTVRSLAAAIRPLAPGGAVAAAQAIPLLDRSQGLPLSRAQSRLWFLRQLEPDSPSYNVALAVKITGPLDTALFAQVLGGVMARHEVLNTVIHSEGEQRQMRPAGAALPLPFTLLDWHARPAEGLEQAAIAHAGLEQAAIAHLVAAAKIPFALDRERPVRLTLLRTGADQVFAMVLMDHIATDGWSIGLFAEELLSAYAAAADGQAPPQRPPSWQYADFAAWWDAQVDTRLLAAELPYWDAALAGLPRLALPTDHPRPAHPGFAGARLAFTLDAGLSTQLRRKARQHTVTLFMLLLTAFEVLLRHRSGQDDIVVGTDIAGRDHPQAERIVGFFVNQLVLRTDFGGATSFAQMLEQVRTRVLEAFFHQHVPFEALVQRLNPVRDGGMPLFQVKFVLQNAPMAALDWPAGRIEPVDIDTGTAKYDLLLTVVDEPQLRGTLEYSSALFSADTAQDMLQDFKAVLAQAACDTSVSYDSLQRLLAASGQARADAAKQALRRAGLQRLRQLSRPST